ncbi:MAG: asparagine synthase-related protein [Candidatus Krumholzibacteriota bacterium]|nr:asparagine synthase-related protein [Candidatus Krumholzibacteriota bacterium]
MNYIVGIFNRKELSKKGVSISREHFDDDTLNFSCSRSSNFSFDYQPFSYNPETGILCGALGYFTNLDELKKRYLLDKVSDTEIIGELYKLTDLKFLEEIEGHFLIFIYDQNLGKMYILQPEHGSFLPVYYIQNSGELIFSTSLKMLLKHSNIKREMDILSARKFLYHEHIIPDDATLIKGVKKLVPQKYLVMDKHSNTLMTPSVITRRLKISRIEAEENFVKYINNNIAKINSKLIDSPPAITLTAGYDSNLILFLLRSMTDAQINAITVNGGDEHNEVPVVENILKNYKDINLLTKDFNREVISSIPDLVWRYEGYLFEGGMFLRYYICNLLREHGIKTAVFGAGSNEILSREKQCLFHSKIDNLTTLTKNLIKRTFIGSLYYKTLGSKLPDHILRREFMSGSLRVKYNISFDYILKMHDILLNSFNIQGLHPFISKEIISAALLLRSENKEKRLFKEKARHVIGEEIGKQLEQSDIVSDTEYIFKSSEDILLKVLHKETTRRLLTSKQIKLLKNNSLTFHTFIIQLVYLHLFNTLFISGEYDTNFKNDGIDFKLDELI